MRRALGAALLLVVALATPGCSADDDAGPRLRVLAAASLSSTFEDLAAEFERTHEGVDVQLSFGGSSDLVAQVQEGAPADVIATADVATMDRLVAEGLTDGDPHLFATNVLQVAVPAGNPAGVRGLADLDAGSDADLVVCAPEVPCGAAAARLAEVAGVRLSPVSEEQSVTDVLGKVVSGEADAGLVYVTDVIAAGDAVEGIAVPEADRVVNDYPVAALADSEEPALAQEFVDLVLGPAGREALGAAGFGAP
ncbi:molybdate ABC transporter substrate-binding protein [Nocardioides sp. zg-579]|uniref:Molybdate ABC transporter substrate-binding protein n=1 Tax=Nocardioides marmotae TaxID=2663857 RepID=A0A6I3J9A4_9ACTN|nr:molybdate ABC transporter substrate-binding protein [Nocardioides marmotae]MCR6030554.1 molybdate ABC transporter substrate-binding protein [Gordonia jinghuaiqii]MTB94190.1 molybdate ABC transporter substrate-binding protein [Nocardioides marmotae]QKE00478.1 molybdate ABC transporter substrate-binding protein [Nocardioides marmotae]